jgi:hypothetical protein
VEYEGKRYSLSPVDAVANSRRRRPDRLPARDAASEPVSFDPGCITRPDDAASDSDDEEDADAIF